MQEMKYGKFICRNSKMKTIIQETMHQHTGSCFDVGSSCFVLLMRNEVSGGVSWAFIVRYRIIMSLIL